MITVLECQIDDSTAEELGYLFEILIKHENILDVYFTPVMMKKNRLGTLVTVLTLPQNANEIERFLLKQSTTLGVRKNECQRTFLERSFKSIELYGETIKIKIAKLDDELIKAVPEYEDVKKVSIKTGIPIRSMFEEIVIKYKQIISKEEV